jgi:hypothetical protein
MCVGTLHPTSYKDRAMTPFSQINNCRKVQKYSDIVVVVVVVAAATAAVFSLKFFCEELHIPPTPLSQQRHVPFMKSAIHQKAE